MQKQIECIIKGWLPNGNKVLEEIQPHWNFRDNLAKINVVAMEKKRIIVPRELEQQALDQVGSNHMGIFKAKLLQKS